MTPHAELLRLIGEVRPDRVPRGLFIWTDDEDKQFGSAHGPGFIVHNDCGEFNSDEFDGAAFAMIELAAWRVVRDYYAEKGEYTVVADLPNMVNIGFRGGWIGIGPDDVTALIAALTYIKENSK